MVRFIHFGLTYPTRLWSVSTKIELMMYSVILRYIQAECFLQRIPILVDRLRSRLSPTGLTSGQTGEIT